MSEHNYKYTDESLDLGAARDYVLLLQIDAASFSYIIAHNGQLLAWAENCPLAELTNPQELSEILTAEYKQVIAGVNDTGFTLVPKSLYDGEYAANIARLLNVSAENSVYAQDFDGNNVIVYKTQIGTPDASGLAALHEQLTVHRAKGWVSAVANNYPTSTDIFLNVENSVVEVLNFNYNRLRYFNSFTYKNHEELGYFVALVASELKLKPADITLVFSGDINAADMSFSYLTDFFGHVKLNTIQTLDLPEAIVPHKILSLAALSLCASSEEN
ncbi:DUF3822 family protein [Mucilaginibacter terrenus]|uniref:DUF3822 family protein n=1 Tax=Mucilaginibacter terrenus TaxID=2482727 RepID=A0A3E2NUK9_9SPHI|nr:DUF3822 family protein [Mucilaginibacter terrenus]RFZ84540.1 DUF3822 family protein [Mucilaginibacter terrenus]